jgi:hypothetical protein
MGPPLPAVQGQNCDVLQDTVVARGYCVNPFVAVVLCRCMVSVATLCWCKALAHYSAGSPQLEGVFVPLPTTALRPVPNKTESGSRGYQTMLLPLLSLCLSPATSGPLHLFQPWLTLLLLLVLSCSWCDFPTRTVLAVFMCCWPPILAQVASQPAVLWCSPVPHQPLPAPLAAPLSLSLRDCDWHASGQPRHVLPMRTAVVVPTCLAVARMAIATTDSPSSSSSYPH